LVATNNEGHPLMQRQERRDEVRRCLQIIGWSQMQYADRIGLKIAGVAQIMHCKVDVADSDIRWLQRLAEAVASIPRPAIANDPDTPEVARLAAPIGAAVTIHATEGELNAVAAKTRDVALEETARAIAEVYRWSGSTGEVSEHELAGAKWALAKVAESLGIVDRVRVLIRQVPMQQVEPEPIPGESMVHTWTPPLPEPAPAREAVSREPFA